MKFTLLEMVQEILSAMDSDEVNSISDTVESNQVALLIRSIYYDLAIDLGLPEHESLFELDASGDPLKPTLMTVPDAVDAVRNIKYNVQLANQGETFSNYRSLDFVPFEDFLDQQAGLRNSTNVGQMTFQGANGEDFEIMYKTDAMPTKYTTFDDHTFLFDGYLNTEDTTLQKSKTMCMGVRYPVFNLVDTFIPDLDSNQFSLLKNAAKVRAFAEIKQSDHREAAGHARRQKVIAQKRKWNTPDLPPIFKLVARYGRRGSTVNRRIPKNLKQGV